MDFKTILTVSDFEEIITQNTGVLMYFSTLSCAVGEALEPKIIDLLKTDFPKIPFYFIDINATPEISARYSVFVEPTILVFFEGKETIKMSRHISLFELSEAIARLYKLVF
jgi:thiol-disulfide isomerase/thioredoxin